MDSQQALENELMQVMKRLSVPYHNAINTLTKTASDLQSQPNQNAVTAVNWLNRLQPAMEMINQHDQIMQPLITQWNQRNLQAVGALREALDKHTSLLSELISLINQVEKLMIEKKQQITPQVDVTLQQSKVRNAYKAAMA